MLNECGGKARMRGNVFDLLCLLNLTVPVRGNPVECSVLLAQHGASASRVNAALRLRCSAATLLRRPRCRAYIGLVNSVVRSAPQRAPSSGGRMPRGGSASHAALLQGAARTEAHASVVDARAGHQNAKIQYQICL